MKLPRFATVLARTVGLGSAAAYMVATQADPADATCWGCSYAGGYAHCAQASGDSGIVGCGFNGPNDCFVIYGSCS